METEIIRDSSYEFHAGMWRRLPVLPWTPRQVKRFVGKEQPMREEEKWAPAGFETSPSLLFGSDWGVNVEVRQPLEEEGRRDRLPLCVTVEISDGISFDVICPDLPDVLALVAQVLPLIAREEADLETGSRREHFGYNGHVIKGSTSRDCEYCQASQERERESAR